MSSIEEVSAVHRSDPGVLFPSIYTYDKACIDWIATALNRSQRFGRYPEATAGPSILSTIFAEYGAQASGGAEPRTEIGFTCPSVDHLLAPYEEGHVLHLPI